MESLTTDYRFWTAMLAFSMMLSMVFVKLAEKDPKTD